MRRTPALVVVLLLASLAGCSGKDKPDCAGLEKFSKLGGQTVTVLAPETHSEQLSSALKPFTQCTGAAFTVQTPSAGQDVATALNARLAAGTTPDVALIPHHQFKTLADKGGVLQPLPADGGNQLTTNFAASWNQLMTFRQKPYGVPVDLEMKSLVWYSPEMFKAKNLAVPQTWEDLQTLTAKIAASGLPAGTKPWCAGFSAPKNKSGWVGTDWIEDALLRTAGTAVYDKWVSHNIPFNDARVLKATNAVSGILRNPAYTNGGLGSPAGIAETSYAEAGLPILSGQCYLHRQANFYAWPAESVGPDTKIWAFYLPAPKAAKGKPVLGIGDIAAAFSQTPRAQAVQTYFATTAFANARAAAPESKGWVSANRKMDLNALPNELDRQVSRWLQADDVQFRYDGSDEMPGSIGQGAFWKAMITWISTKQSDQAMLDSVQKAWPASK